MNLINKILILCFCASIALSFGSEGLKSDGSLNKKQISNWYFDGDFVKVRDILEKYRKTHPQLTDKEKIFIYKHLSVIYAASSDSRDKAESYMYQLVKLKPTIELLDMYISDNIESIFQNVKSKYKSRMEYLESLKKEEQQETLQQQKASADTGAKAPVSSSEKSKKSKKSKKWIWWTVGGATVAVAVIIFLVLSGDDGGDDNTDPI